MTRLPVALAVAAALALGACAELGARAVGAGGYLADAAEGYVREAHALRQWIRAECADLLREEVRDLRAAGDGEAARARLKAAYPPLVTIEALASARADPAEILARPFGCD